MELLPLIVAVVVGLALVALFMRHQANASAGHVAQLQPKKKVKPEFRTYTREEVAKHATRDDVWVVITHKRTGEHRVYDLTDYVDEHPGGESILNNMGGDSTEGFNGPQHPDTAFFMAEEFCIGKVEA